MTRRRKLQPAPTVPQGLCSKACPRCSPPDSMGRHRKPSIALLAYGQTTSRKFYAKHLEQKEAAEKIVTRSREAAGIPIANLQPHRLASGFEVTHHRSPPSPPLGHVGGGCQFADNKSILSGKCATMLPR